MGKRRWSQGEARMATARVELAGAGRVKLDLDGDGAHLHGQSLAVLYGQISGWRWLSCSFVTIRVDASHQLQNT